MMSHPAMHPSQIADPRWSLSGQARGQLEEYGITLAELFRLMTRPANVLPGEFEGERRFTGWGLIASVRDHEIVFVGLDGASRWNAGEWAVQRAQFRDADTAGAEALLTDHLRISKRVDDHARAARARAGRGKARTVNEFPVEVRFVEPRPKPAQPSPTTEVVDVPRSIPTPRRTVKAATVLAQIHPRLRSTVTQMAAGDWSRVVVYSRTKVGVL